METPPTGSWEAWIVALREGKNMARPDKKNSEADLPLWVDCHLSWAVDVGKEKSGLRTLPKQWVLKSTQKECTGQLETL